MTPRKQSSQFEEKKSNTKNRKGRSGRKARKAIATDPARKEETKFDAVPAKVESEKSEQYPEVQVAELTP